MAKLAKLQDAISKEALKVLTQASNCITNEGESVEDVLIKKISNSGYDGATQKDFVPTVNSEGKLVLSAIPLPDVSAQISKHNTSVDAHQDIRDKFLSYFTKEETKAEIAKLFDTAPETLDTITEIVAAIESNQDVLETLNTAIGTKLNKTDAETLYVALQGYVAYSQGEKEKLQKYPSPAVADKDKVLTVNAAGNIVPMATQTPELPDNVVTGFDEGITKVWEGTKAEFDAIAIKDAQTVSFVTDDMNPENYITQEDLATVLTTANYVTQEDLSTAFSNKPDLLYGDVVPAASLGKNGDYYIKTS